MVRIDVVRRKLAHLAGYLDELSAHEAVTFEQYEKPGGPRRAIERLIQLVVETAVDVNVHLVTETSGSPPTSYRASFAGAAKYGLISSSLANDLAPSAGLRNALTHEYADIDDARVHASIGLILRGFREYAAAVGEWLGAQQN